MIIAVNSRFPADPVPDGYLDFMHRLVSAMAEQFPEHQFTVIAGQSFNQSFGTKSNITVEVSGPDSIPALLRPFWYRYRLPALLRKIGAGIYFSADGTVALKTGMRQVCLTGHPDWLTQPKFYSRGLRSFYKKLEPLFLQKANRLVCFSSAHAELINKLTPLPKEKMAICFPLVNPAYKPIDEQHKESIRKKYTGEVEYFLCCGHAGPSGNLINLLKAFSIFKKRQKSQMRLVIAGTGITSDENWIKAFRTYKFRDEVLQISKPSEEELSGLMAAAYAFVDPSCTTSWHNHASDAIQCGVPLICSDLPAHQEWFGHAALYCHPDDHTGLAEHMMLLFKDENRRNELIYEGSVIAGMADEKKQVTGFMKLLLETGNV